MNSIAADIFPFHFYVKNPQRSAYTSVYGFHGGFGLVAQSWSGYWPFALMRKQRVHFSEVIRNYAVRLWRDLRNLPISVSDFKSEPQIIGALTMILGRPPQAENRF